MSRTSSGTRSDRCNLLDRAGWIDKARGGANGIDAVVAAKNLDAIVAPTGHPARTTDLINGDHFLGASSSIAAIAGYPIINVPMGRRGLSRNSCRRPRRAGGRTAMREDGQAGHDASAIRIKHL